MIDQSNRAGKSCSNNNDNVKKENSPCKLSSTPSSTMTKRLCKHQQNFQKLSLIERKLHRRTNRIKPPIGFGQLSPPYLKKGKRV